MLDKLSTLRLRFPAHLSGYQPPWTRSSANEANAKQVWLDFFIDRLQQHSQQNKSVPRNAFGFHIGENPIPPML
jgi:hypothetical protein